MLFEFPHLAVELLIVYPLVQVRNAILRGSTREVQPARCST